MELESKPVAPLQRYGAHRAVQTPGYHRNSTREVHGDSGHWKKWSPLLLEKWQWRWVADEGRAPCLGISLSSILGDHCIGHTAFCSTERVALRLRRSWPPLWHLLALLSAACQTPPWEGVTWLGYLFLAPDFVCTGLPSVLCTWKYWRPTWKNVTFYL